MTYYSGAKYTGDFKDGEQHGKGTYTTNNSGYTGDFKNGAFHGIGTFTYADGKKYTGEVKNYQRNGIGIITLADGTIETGYWVDDEYWGTVSEWDKKVAKDK